jgi:transposase
MALIRSRDALVSSRTQLVNHVRGAVKSFGEPACPSARLGASTKEGLTAHPRGAFACTRSHLGAEIGSLTQRILKYDRRLEAIAKEHYPETALLRQVEGIGPLTALTFVLSVEDPYRFERSRSVGAYLGFVPARDRSGERDSREKRIFRRRATRCSGGCW